MAVPLKEELQKWVGFACSIQLSACKASQMFQVFELECVIYFDRLWYADEDCLHLLCTKNKFFILMGEENGRE